jgi:hypothetical protein
MNIKERNQHFDGRIGLRKRMRVSFGSEEEIERMITEGVKKGSGCVRAGKGSGIGVSRSPLGLRNDWLLSLNIGNVMHLTPIHSSDVALPTI